MIYPSTHNLGSIKNGCISCSTVVTVPFKWFTIFKTQPWLCQWKRYTKVSCLLYIYIYKIVFCSLHHFSRSFTLKIQPFCWPLPKKVHPKKRSQRKVPIRFDGIHAAFDGWKTLQAFGIQQSAQCLGALRGRFDFFLLIWSNYNDLTRPHPKR